MVFDKMKKHIVLTSLGIAFIIPVLTFVFRVIAAIGTVRGGLESIQGLPGTLAVGTLITYPFVLTGFNVFFIFADKGDLKHRRNGRIIEVITLVLGVVLTGMYLSFSEIQFTMDFQETLQNDQVHTPVFTEAQPTVLVLACLAVIGYLVLSRVKVNRMPPLVAVFSIAAMYIGMILSILWMIQLTAFNQTNGEAFSSPTFFLQGILLSLLPFNCILIAIKVIREKVREWNETEHQQKAYNNKFLQFLQKKLMRSENWPMLAFILIWPLLGLFICILALFGQQPDSIIKAWTETSDWTFSQKESPPNVEYDEHYLCTVAAGGHAKIVKPLRTGQRHGHQVIVNRQLCIANGFEQVLEERVPRIHKRIRGFYDRYGFPVARLIKSPYAADLVYVLMKPLEWVFLFVLYLVDVHPENRIAKQYPPK